MKLSLFLISLLILFDQSASSSCTSAKIKISDLLNITVNDLVANLPTELHQKSSFFIDSLFGRHNISHVLFKFNYVNSSFTYEITDKILTLTITNAQLSFETKSQGISKTSLFIENCVVSGRSDNYTFVLKLELLATPENSLKFKYLTSDGKVSQPTIQDNCYSLNNVPNQIINFFKNDEGTTFWVMNSFVKELLLGLASERLRLFPWDSILNKQMQIKNSFYIYTNDGLDLDLISTGVFQAADKFIDIKCWFQKHNYKLVKNAVYAQAYKLELIQGIVNYLSITKKFFDYTFYKKDFGRFRVVFESKYIKDNLKSPEVADIDEEELSYRFKSGVFKYQYNKFEGHYLVRSEKVTIETTLHRKGVPLLFKFNTKLQFIFNFKNVSGIKIAFDIGNAFMFKPSMSEDSQIKLSPDVGEESLNQFNIKMNEVVSEQAETLKHLWFDAGVSVRRNGLATELVNSNQGLVINWVTKEVTKYESLRMIETE